LNVIPFNFNACFAQYMDEAARDGNCPRGKSWDYVWDYFQPFVALFGDVAVNVAVFVWPGSSERDVGATDAVQPATATARRA
jgi:biotin synthase-related radical SAM superfamily protein